MDRYGWLALTGVGWAILVGVATAVYARWTFARRGWTAPLQTRAYDRTQRTQSSFDNLRLPVRTPEPAPARPRHAERRVAASTSSARHAAPVARPPVRLHAAAPTRLAVKPPAPRIEEPEARPAVVASAPEPPPMLVATPAPELTPTPVAVPVASVPDGDPQRQARRPSTLALLQRLSDPDPMRRTTALWEATSLPDADRIMIRALSDEFPMVRREAVRVLGEIGSEEATKALTEVSAHDTSSEVREEAIAALAEVIRRRKGAAFEDSTG